MYRLTLSLACLILLTASCSYALPNKRNDQSGSIQIETDTVNKDPFPILQDKIIDQLKNGTLTSLSQSELVYLNAAYLYCTLNKGTCPEILDALLFADYSTSKSQNSATCPLLESFWKQWIENQFEQRQNYLGKIAFFSQTNEFNTKRRNGYIKCRQTIGQMLTQQTQPPTSDVNAKAVAILEQIKKVVPNVIDNVGAQAKSAPATPKADSRSEQSRGAPAAPVTRP